MKVTEVFEPEAVFVDSTGRRRWFARAAGIVAGCCLTVYLVVVAVGLTVGARAPFTPWPGGKPSTRTGLPGHGAVTPQPLSPRSGSPRPRNDSKRAPGAPGDTTPTARTSATSGSSPAPRASQAAKGRAYGRTKSPNPKKP